MTAGSAVAESHLIEPHGGELVERTGERPDDLDSLETIRLTPRELADLDMLASGALSPLTGFMGSDDYERVVDEMRLANGLAVGVAGLPGRRGGPRRRSRRARRRRGWSARRPRRRGGLLLRQGAGGRALLPYDRGRASRCRAPLRTGRPVPRRARHHLRAAGASLPFAPSRPCGHSRALRGAGLAARGRLPDEEPDPPRPRVPHEVRARDRRRAPHPPAGRRDEVGRRAGGGPRAGVRRARRGLLPG